MLGDPRLLETTERLFGVLLTALAVGVFARLQDVAASGGNVFEELMETVKTASLGRISNALYSVGGQYRRNM